MTNAQHDSVERTLGRLRLELGRDLEHVAGLRAVARQQDVIADFVADLDRQLQRVQSAAVITLVGSTGAGKSTLLNALVGESIAVEGDDRPTTRAPVIYRPRDADISELLAGLPGESPRVVDYDPLQDEGWDEQILIDAPDTNSVTTLHREVVRELADRSDVLVVVAHRQSVSELSSVEFVEHFAGRRGLLFVLNRADELADDARAELLAQLKQLVLERFRVPDARVLSVSALAARRDPTEPAFAELCGQLRELVRGKVLGRVRRHNAIGTAGRIGELFAQLESELRPDLDGLDHAIDDGLTRFCQAVDEEVAARLRLRRANVKGLLWNETAKRWDGPGGWALKVGGLSALGLGAGAALVRRNPLLAAGATVGALAAEKARGVMRERELNDAGNLLPGMLELERWYRRDFAVARGHAQELVGEPSGLGVPDASTLAEHTTEAIVEAWDQLVERELLEAADAAAPAYVRWPIDLPVYALFGWIVWSAARGFFTADYVGLDFLVNAALILAAWLFVARSLVRGLLATRCVTLLKQTRERVSQALSAQAADLGGDSRAARGALREALARLAESEGHWRARISSESREAER